MTTHSFKRDVTRTSLVFPVYGREVIPSLLPLPMGLIIACHQRRRSWLSGYRLIAMPSAQDYHD